MAASLYVVKQGAKLQKRSRRLVVTKDDEEIQSVPLIKIDRVYLLGNIGVTTPALTWLMREGIDIVFCDQHGKFKGRVIGPDSGHSQLRRLQYRRVDTPTFALNTARSIVQAKLHNSRVLLQRYRRRLERPDLDYPIQRLHDLHTRANNSRAIKSLLGTEGVGAAVYFEAFATLFKDPHWVFAKRVRRPPTDPVNVLLSFGYTLLSYQMQAAVEMVGLDPYLGFLHADAYNRPSLALDLTEEFRSIIVDSVVLKCLNNQLITPDNFSSQADSSRPILLDDTGRNIFLREFETRLALTFKHPAREEKVTWRRCFELQSRAMAQAIQSDGLYQPFRVR